MTLLLFIYGACMGSWLTAMADRYATNTSPIFPASHCDTCQIPLTPWQLVPILSYCLLRGRCANCHAAIPATTLLVEGLAGLTLTTLTPGNGVIYLWLGLWGFAALCDAQTQSFPGWVSLTAIGLVLPQHSWLTSLLIVFAYGSMRLLWTHWSRPPIGDGDLEMMLSYCTVWGSTATAKWLLVACILALLTPTTGTRRAFLPALFLSALGWWLWSLP